ncbi:zinc finger CCCH domain-containing protein 44-like [Impatiens glandulifera]|uniref:zinc finger CCCH domain-containing protein 44-like n=1 Tax=Impatiens glandulifera TaxID=253017 RepID=UPI001FB15C01|nr:zinc finger CCCH domain-containing protein 44-like [Impatiens glandulifera]
MEGREFSLSGSCMPSSGLKDTSLNHSDINGHEPIQKVDNTVLMDPPAAAGEADGVVNGGGEEGSGSKPVLEQEKTMEIGGGKRRGRPRRDQPRMPQVKKVKDEEDVCFICYDGGSLVLCDRRGCPKAYHPVCVKHDDTYFRAKSKWNCGWHICSTCEKPAHYMCYTCTYSLCKNCSKGVDFLCVRENKGFCSLCIRTIMLIENKDQREMDKIDFDDKTSWEYLFKMYWLYIKGKVSLSMDEITKAKNLLKASGSSARKGKDLVAVNGSNDILDAHYECKDLVVNRLRSKRGQKMKLSHCTSSPVISKPISTDFTDLCASVVGCAKWASKELLAFVAHVKNGDESEISPPDAQVLLLDYVQRNDLCDPNQTSQIICDTRLAKLFGKPRVGHFEMLKLLEFHFPMKDDSPKVVSQCNITPVIVSEAEGNGNNDLYLRSNDKKRKSCTDLSEYAAIDVHNINLIYLRRHLLENLVNDINKFHEKVVGSIVRISFSCGDQKQERFGLVQVIGTCKVPIPYKIGENEKTVDVVLEIFNMDKKETISIDTVSNEKFSEEECRSLKESIKCGLVKHLTVGFIQEKAKALREVIVNDCLEAEVLQLNRLRDVANENGHENMLREYVERLELLKSPEEIERRLKVAPEVHIDPSLNQSNKSFKNAEEIDEKREVKHLKIEHSVPNKNENETIPSVIAEGSSKSTPTSVTQGLDNATRVVDSSGSAVGGCNSPAVISSASFSGVASENSTGSPPLSNTNENENFWRYRDSKGKLQGPFCLSQLRKWYTSGLLPSDMKTWSIYDDEHDSLLLTDVLKGQQSRKLSSRQSSISLPSQGVSENSGLTLTSAVLDKSPTYKCVDINKTSSPNIHSDPTLTATIIPAMEVFSGELDLNSSFSPTTNSENKVQIEEFEFQNPPGNQPDIEELDNNTLMVPTSDVNSWLEMLTEPIEFNTLDEESVSDLLDQVDAMESRGGMDFPSASMNNNVDYLFEDLSSQPDSGKGDPELSRNNKAEGFMNPPPWIQSVGHDQRSSSSVVVKVCEFYASGKCMKGAFCEYLHQ